MSCDLGYICVICDQPIEDKKIPMAVKGKIGIQMLWHEACEK